MKKRIKCAFSVLICLSLTLCSAKIAYADSSNNRISGIDRYETSVEISKAGWTSSNNVILATGSDFPDALCAAPLANKLGAPILLVSKDSISSSAAAEIQRLGAKNIFIVGGTGVISDNIKNSLESSGKSVIRLGGTNRYETSAIVAKNYFSDSTEAAIATGDDFPDALSIASIAAYKKMPILLISKNSIDSSISNFLNSSKVNSRYIVGGNGVISDNTFKSINGTRRLSGSTRYDTNSAILNFFADTVDFSTAYLATGEDFPDALTGSALASQKCNPVILIEKSPEKATTDFTSSRGDTIKQFKAFGGTGVVPDYTITTVQNSLNNYIKGIDVSEYQGTIDWNAVKNSGYKFAIVRISHGSNVDANFEQNIEGAKNAGLKTGAYHYGTFENADSAHQEAQSFISNINALKAKGLNLDYLVLDSENDTSADLTDASIKFLDEIKAAFPSTKIIFYANPYFIQTHYNSTIAAKYPILWIANYNVSTPSTPLWNNWSIWQARNTGAVLGISGDVDIDFMKPEFFNQ